LPSFDVSEKIVVVTGAGRGLGAGIALRFAEAGADVVLHYFTSSNSAKDVLGKVEGLGRRGVLVQGDLTRPEDVDRLFKETDAKCGRVDVLINNSGIYPETPLLEMTPSDWHKVVDANLTTAFLSTQAAARLMIAHGTKGVIINIASIEAENSDINHSHYCAAKAGLVMFTRVAARTWALRNSCQRGFSGPDLEGRHREVVQRRREALAESSATWHDRATCRCC